MFYFHHYLWKIPSLTIIFFRGVGEPTTNQLYFSGSQPCRLGVLDASIKAMEVRGMGIPGCWTFDPMEG